MAPHPGDPGLFFLWISQHSKVSLLCYSLILIRSLPRRFLAFHRLLSSATRTTVVAELAAMRWSLLVTALAGLRVVTSSVTQRNSSISKPSDFGRPSTFVTGYRGQESGWYGFPTNTTRFLKRQATATNTSSASSTPTVAPGFVCPDNDGMEETNSYGETYQVVCFSIDDSTDVLVADNSTNSTTEGGYYRTTNNVNCADTCSQWNRANTLSNQKCLAATHYADSGECQLKGSVGNRSLFANVDVLVLLRSPYVTISSSLSFTSATSTSSTSSTEASTTASDTTTSASVSSEVSTSISTTSPESSSATTTSDSVSSSSISTTSSELSSVCIFQSDRSLSCTIS